MKPPEMPTSVDNSAPGGAAEEAYDALLSKQHNVRVDVPGRAELDKLGTHSGAGAAAQVRSASHKEEASSRSADQQQSVDVRWDGEQQRVRVAAVEGLNNGLSENGDAAVGHANEAAEASTAAATAVALHEDGAAGNVDEAAEASTAAAPAPASAAAVVRGEDLLEGKDKLKQTLHYKKTEEAEWASRQQEIERQVIMCGCLLLLLV